MLPLLDYRGSNHYASVRVVHAPFSERNLPSAINTLANVVKVLARASLNPLLVFLIQSLMFGLGILLSLLRLHLLLVDKLSGDEHQVLLSRYCFPLPFLGHR